MNIQQKTTILRLALDGYFIQNEASKPNSADSIFSLADDIEDYVQKNIPDQDRVYCLSLVKEVKTFAEKCFKNPGAVHNPDELSTLMGKLIHLAHVKPTDLNR